MKLLSRCECNLERTLQSLPQFAVGNLAQANSRSAAADERNPGCQVLLLAGRFHQELLAQQ
jgi:hypothetical protein